MLKGWSPFARRYWGNLGWFLFLRVLRYFSSPGLPLHPMYSGVDIVQVRWVSPFGNPRIKVCLPTPRGLSQATTSFIAFSCQGIHQMHFYAWPYNPTYFESRARRRDQRFSSLPPFVSTWEEDWPDCMYIEHSLTCVFTRYESPMNTKTHS